MCNSRKGAHTKLLRPPTTMRLTDHNRPTEKASQQSTTPPTQNPNRHPAKTPVPKNATTRPNDMQKPASTAHYQKTATKDETLLRNPTQQKKKTNDKQKKIKQIKAQITPKTPTGSGVDPLAKVIRAGLTGDDCGEDRVSEELSKMQHLYRHNQRVLEVPLVA